MAIFLCFYVYKHRNLFNVGRLFFFIFAKNIYLKRYGYKIIF